MEIASMHSAVHPRSRADDQSETSRMVQLLRAFHAFGVPAHRAACRPIVGPLGLSQIQEAPPSPHAGLGMAPSRSSATPYSTRIVLAPATSAFHHTSPYRGARTEPRR